eukprot:TRINITY_DN5625_c0_g1_i1.p1 TRINITY_DN5625_c0_g1~~TRINITY_DN5625_c0_g1_i1.p1  ORF type:complete len:682 (+),score=226.40 TRINITY_DN5625_c0_g1_i1:3-2048(+)
MQEFDEDEEALGFISRIRKTRASGRVPLSKRKLIIVGVASLFVAVLVISITLLAIKLERKSSDVENADLAALADYINSAIDNSTSPCTDFYQYACGKWISKYITSVTNNYARSFNTIANQIQTELAGILNKRPDPLLNVIWDDCMQGATEGGQPLRPFISAIDAITDLKGVFNVSAFLTLYAIPTFFSMGVEPDMSNTYLNAFSIYQGGLTLPTPQFYLSNDSFSLYYRELYAASMKSALAVISGTSANAASILQLETDIAKFTVSPSQQGSPETMYHPVNMSTLTSLTPHLNWTTAFQTWKISPKRINVEYLQFLTNMDLLLSTTPLSTIKWFLKWKVIANTASYLGSSNALRNAHMEFQRILNPTAAPTDKESSCVAYVDGLLGDRLGKYYSQTVDPEKRQAALELIEDVREGFQRNLAEISWMDNSTKAATLQKLLAIKSKVLYPDTWLTYDGVNLIPGKPYDNAMTILKYLINLNFQQVDKPVDKNDWLMTPQTVNAYYNPTNNEIVIPAGILGMPFYSLKFPAWANFGGIGMVLGHEITHGFDNSGRWFDANGTLRDWWPKDVSDIYSEKAQCIVDTYDEYHAAADINVNGKVTEGENIADLGGIRIAYSAYKSHVEKSGQGFSDELIRKYFPDHTDDQLFFLNFGQLWCDVATNQYKEIAARDGTHSPVFKLNSS